MSLGCRMVGSLWGLAGAAVVPLPAAYGLKVAFGVSYTVKVP